MADEPRGFEHGGDQSSIHAGSGNLADDETGSVRAKGPDIEVATVDPIRRGR